MIRTSVKSLLFTVVTLLILAGCNFSDMGGKTVEAYLNALVNGDREQMVLLTCEDFQKEAMLEFDSFQGVKSSLDNVKCKQVESKDGNILVTCSGNILATYGNEVQKFDLSNQTYHIIQDEQEWLICGRD